ncbi:hypothetical protein H206_00142 [Candidatus Electrothrix aarhusensis]|uniref:Uncharacterized protein n=1 Tax=Candidatus Electrothrix aarhusensis TaxID=1859131 RepID=A0A444J262_9BACT|nr:hypothetical protein H206_00142 [Candidatus Electrothrix aarhusensis]
MIKNWSGFLSRQILFSKNNGYFFIACCFSIKTLNIHNVQDGNVNILYCSLSSYIFSRYLLLTMYITRKSGQSALSLPAFTEVFPESYWIGYVFMGSISIPCPFVWYISVYRVPLEPNPCIMRLGMKITYIFKEDRQYVLIGSDFPTCSSVFFCDIKK